MNIDGQNYYCHQCINYDYIRDIRCVPKIFRTKWSLQFQSSMWANLADLSFWCSRSYSICNSISISNGMWLFGQCGAYLEGANRRPPQTRQTHTVAYVWNISTRGILWRWPKALKSVFDWGSAGTAHKAPQTPSRLGGNPFLFHPHSPTHRRNISKDKIFKILKVDIASPLDHCPVGMGVPPPHALPHRGVRPLD